MGAQDNIYLGLQKVELLLKANNLHALKRNKKFLCQCLQKKQAKI